MNGILLVDKAAGWTSHDVVAKVRAILKANSGQKTKVGHTGTLDPMATGLLILVVGTYTKKAQDFSKQDKIYEVELTLGRSSSTGDAEGELTSISDRQPDLAVVQEVINSFIGPSLQIPPAFSAVKVGGQRAYKLARAGQVTKLEPRDITIYDISEVVYRYPRLNFIAHVSSGTYIRSLANDIGEKMGTGAYLSALRRTSVGDYEIESAIRLEDLKPQNILDYLRL